MKKHIKRDKDVNFHACKNFDNFKDFAGNGELKQAALTAISVQVSSDEIKELKELFI